MSNETSSSSQVATAGAIAPGTAVTGSTPADASLWSQLVAMDWSWLRRAWYFVAAFVLLVGPMVIHLTKAWDEEPNYSHGFLVPLAVAYFLWHKRDRLNASVTAPANSAWWVIVCSLSLYLIGFLGTEFFIECTSLLVCSAAILACFWGWRLVRAMSFEFGLMLCAIPLPTIIFNAIAFPLQIRASIWATGLLRLCGIPVFREGNILSLPQQMLDVAEACSGIRSLISLITLALIVAHFLPVRIWLRGLFVLTSIPIALVANAMRIALSGLLGQYWGPQYSEGFFHLFSGWVIFLFAFGMLLAESSWLSRRRAWRFPASSAGGGIL